MSLFNKKIVCIVYSLTFCLAVVSLAKAQVLPQQSEIESAFTIAPSLLQEIRSKFDFKDLKSVSHVLADPHHPDFSWVNRVYERIVGVGVGSGTILYLTKAGLGVVVSAAHVLDFQVLSTAARDSPVFPGPNVDVVRIDKGHASYEWRNVSHLLFAPKISVHDYDKQALGAKDFLLALMTGERIAAQNSIHDKPMTMIPLRPFDNPGHLRTDAPHQMVLDGQDLPEKLPNMTHVKAGDEVLLIGFPTVANLSLMYAVGHILSDAEAKKLDPSYDPEKQYIVHASGGGHMSGGGLFTRDGSYAGVITVGYFDDKAESLVSNYVGGVRASWIEKQFLTYLATLPASERHTILHLIR